MLLPRLALLPDMSIFFTVIWFRWTCIRAREVKTVSCRILDPFSVCIGDIWSFHKSNLSWMISSCEFWVRVLSSALDSGLLKASLACLWFRCVFDFLVPISLHGGASSTCLRSVLVWFGLRRALNLSCFNDLFCLWLIEFMTLLLLS